MPCYGNLLSNALLIEDEVTCMQMLAVNDAAKQQYMLALEQNPDCVEAIVHLGYNLQVIQVICCCVVKKLIYYNLFLYWNKHRMIWCRVKAPYHNSEIIWKGTYICKELLKQIWHLYVGSRGLYLMTIFHLLMSNNLAHNLICWWLRALDRLYINKNEMINEYILPL